MFLALPTTWPDTASDEFLCNVAVTQARKIMSEGGAAAESRFKANANECLHNVLQKVGLPPSMQLPRRTTSGTTHPGECGGIRHRRNCNGYRAAILPREVIDQPVFDSWGILTSGLVSLILNLPKNLRDYIKETDLMTPSL